MPDNEDQVTIAQAIDLLKSRQVTYPDQFPVGASEADLEKAGRRLPVPIPPVWQDVLKVSDGFGYYGSGLDCYFSGTNNISMTDSDDRKMLSDLSPPHILIAEESSGDCFTLDVTRQTADGDCPVIWVVHDDDNEEFGTIAEFLIRILKDDQDEDE